jgi:Carboxypeptidase regulatory-like domain
MPTIILRALDAVLWSKVQAKAQADSCTPKQVVLKAIAQYVGLVVVLLLTTACANGFAAPTPEPPAPKPVVPKAAVDCSAVGTLPCQQGPLPAPTPTPGPTTITLRGTVIDGTSGSPLPNIAVVATTGVILHTDAGGGYQFTHVPTGFLTVVFSAQGYVTQIATPTVTADATLDIVLQRSAAAPTPAPAPAPVPGPPPVTPGPAPVPVLVVTLQCTAAAHGVATTCNLSGTFGGEVIAGTAFSHVEYDFGDGFADQINNSPLVSRVYTIAGPYTIVAKVTVGTIQGVQTVTVSRAIVVT